MRRLLSGAVAAFVMATGATALFSGPAQAAKGKPTVELYSAELPPDGSKRVTVELSSTKVQVGGSKQVTFTVTNTSDQDLVKPLLAIDQESYHYDDVRFPFNEESCQAGAVVTMDCPLTPAPLPAGRSAKLVTTFKADDDAPVGSAGTLRVYVHYEGDNGGEIFQFPLTVEGAPGPDLFAYAADVPPTGALEPGKTAPLIAAFANQGNGPAGDITFRATVPAGAHFVKGQPGDYEGCEFAGRTVTCSAPDAVLPANSGLVAVILPVRLDDDAKPGVNLKNGRVEVSGKPATSPEALAKGAAPIAFPRGMTLPADTVTDADLADNDDRFTVVVAKAPVGNDDDGAGGTGGGDGPALPITGPVAAPAAGAGAVLVAIGVFLLVITRRRTTEESAS